MSLRLDYISNHPPKSIPNPPGYLPALSPKEAAKTAIVKPDAAAVAAKNERATALKMKRAWDLATAPAKSLPMQGVMLYFSGSGVQIFSLAMIFSLLTGPITAVAGILKAFEALRPVPATTNKSAPEPSYLPLIGPMALYVACQGLVLALGLYKCWSMGILPTGAADWLQFETRLPAPEWSAVRSLSEL